MEKDEYYGWSDQTIFQFKIEKLFFSFMKTTLQAEEWKIFSKK